MATWTTTQDVIDRWVGGDPPDDDATLGTLVDDAEEILTSEYDDIADRITAGDLTAGRVVIVVVRMVSRVLRNPAGLRQWTESIGSFSENRTFAGDDPGQPFLTDADRELLGYEPSRKQSAFSVTVGTQETAWLGAVPDLTL